MKKLVSLLLVLLLSVALAVPALAEGSTPVEINPVVLNIFEQTAQEWYAEDASRVLLVTSAMLDVAIGGDEALNDLVVSAIARDGSYVAIDASGTILTVIFFAPETCLTIDFAPATGEVNAFSMAMPSDAAEFIMTSAKNDGTFASYYNIPADDVMMMMDILLEALGE